MQKLDTFAGTSPENVKKIICGEINAAFGEAQQQTQQELVCKEPLSNRN